MNIKRWLISLTIVVAVIAGLGFVKFGQIQQAIAFAQSFPEPSATVIANKAEADFHTQKTKVIGQLRAPKFLKLKNEYAGRITSIGFNPGETVSKGQTLLILDSSEEAARLQAMQAQLKLATSRLARIKKLAEQEEVSEEALDQAMADQAIAKANVINLQTVIQKKTIVAPFDATTGLSQHQIGALLDANSEITELVGTDKQIWVEFQLPQTATQLSVGDAVELSIIGNSMASNTTRLTATVIARQNAINSDSRQIQYRASLDNSAQQLFHNQIVTVFTAKPQQPVVMVPSAAIIRDQLGDYVYVLRQDEQNQFRADRIEVTLGQRLSDDQIVLSGLKGGELIAANGAFKLSQGLLVYLENQASVQGATP